MTNGDWRTPVDVRPIDPMASAEIDLVAVRMRQTLIEVLGEARGGTMYGHAWLVDRVRWHLHQPTGHVFVAVTDAVDIVGHVIVRIEEEDMHGPIGLFSTIYVDPPWRNAGVATALLRQGEVWMCAHGMALAVTYTDKDNLRLQHLFMGRGYMLAAAPDDFVRLSRSLDSCSA